MPVVETAVKAAQRAHVGRHARIAAIEQRACVRQAVLEQIDALHLNAPVCELVLERPTDRAVSAAEATGQKQSPHGHFPFENLSYEGSLPRKTHRPLTEF